MFDISTDKKLNTKLPIIVENFKVIHFDEFPILYYGTNSYGTKIIGSLLEENDATNILRYIHILVSISDFYNFTNQQISYRELLENSNDVFILDKNINEEPILTYSLDIKDIPEDYLPINNYYCPKFNFSIGNDFVLSLHGNIADTNLAFPKELSRLQENFVKILNSALDVFDFLKISPIIRQKAYAPGSFQLKFNVSFEEFNDMFITHESIYQSLGTILKNLIPSSIDEIVDSEQLDDFIKNEDTINTIKNTIEPGGIEITNNLVNKFAEKFEDIVDLYCDLSSNIGFGYNEIELLVESDYKKELVPLSIIDENVKLNFLKLNDIIELKNVSTEIDEFPKSYEICIYSLNTETRAGKALIKNKLDDKIMDRPSIKVLGIETLEKSIYSESLHLNKWIDIHAKATIKNDIFKKLMIEYE